MQVVQKSGMRYETCLEGGKERACVAKGRHTAIAGTAVPGGDWQEDRRQGTVGGDRRAGSSPSMHRKAAAYHTCSGGEN